jgi:uncharacterized protein (TIGR02145 family)
MTSVKHKSRPIRVCVVSIALSIAFGSASASLELERRSALNQKASDTSPSSHSSKRMADGNDWTTQNLAVNTVPSYCYDDSELNCRKYGRLYTWESARRVCESLGGGWRLPTDAEWRQLAKHYGGIREDSNDTGKASYTALSIGGSAAFNALLGGGRNDDGQYARLEAHGFYWTASERDPITALFYNFGRGSQSLNRQIGGNKQMAISVRCVRKHAWPGWRSQ